MLRNHFCFATAITSVFAFIAACDGGSSSDDTGTGGTAVVGSGGASTPSGGTSSAKGGSATTGGTSTGSGGSANTGGSNTPKGGTVTGSGGTVTTTGGTTAKGGSGNAPNTGGTTTTGGNTTSGGAPPSAGTGGGTTTGGTAQVIDPKPNATPGTKTSTNQDYLRLGEMRILNNNWGSEELGCGSKSTMSVFVNQDKTFGWNFNRGDCDTAASNQKPDFPQLEFGIHPFGIGDERVTSPEFSSTTLLPIQIKDVQSATVNIQNLTASFQRESSWNITFEFWISQRHPVTDPDPGVYAELMTFWGWQNGRWPSPPNGQGPTGSGSGAKVQSGGKSYTLWVQDDNWSNGQWRYFQFRVDDGPHKTFNGTLDVKPFLDYLVSSRQYSPDFWVTRLEIGSEIDDNTEGTVQMSGVTFEINGQSRSAVIGP